MHPTQDMGQSTLGELQYFDVKNTDFAQTLLKNLLTMGVFIVIENGTNVGPICNRDDNSLDSSCDPSGATLI